MEKPNVLKIVRDNQEKFKENMDKMNRLNEMEKRLNYKDMYEQVNSNSNNNKLKTISEKDDNTKQNTDHSNYIKKMYDSEVEEYDNNNEYNEDKHVENYNEEEEENSNNDNEENNNSLDKSASQFDKQIYDSDNEIKDNNNKTTTDRKTPKFNDLRSRELTSSSVASDKKHHTAFTYSTIVKMKNSQMSQKKQSVFNDKILTQKKYNGKCDKVALYNYLKGEWNKTPYLAKRTNTVTAQYLYKEWEIKDKADRDFDNTKNAPCMQRMRNLTRPISHYKKL